MVQLCPNSFTLYSFGVAVLITYSTYYKFSRTEEQSWSATRIGTPLLSRNFYAPVAGSVYDNLLLFIESSFFTRSTMIENPSILWKTQSPFYKTRFHDDGRIKNPRIYRWDESKTSFVLDSIAVWNRLPAMIRKSKNPEVFKTNLKPWIANNIEI